MKKRNTLIIIVIVVISIGLWTLGYSLLKKNDQRIRNEALFDVVSEYVQSDSDFTSQYGVILEINLYKNENIVVINNKECHVPCVITTENNQTYLAWIDFDFSGDEEVFEYISVTPINEGELQ